MTNMIVNVFQGVKEKVGVLYYCIKTFLSKSIAIEKYIADSVGWLKI